MNCIQTITPTFDLTHCQPFSSDARALSGRRLARVDAGLGTRQQRREVSATAKCLLSRGLVKLLSVRYFVCAED